MAITTINNRSVNRSDTASSGQLWTATSATASDFQAAAAGGKIGQVIHTGLTSVTSTTSSTASAISGLTATITPSATSSKVLILVYLTGGSTFQLFRGTTQIALGDAASSRSRATFGYRGEQHFNNYSAFPWHVSWVDSPSSTSALTYSVKWFISSGTLYLNRSLDNTDNANYHRTVSHITAMEVLA